MADETGRVSVVPAGKWSVDASRSSVTFALKHMMLATVNGHFREFDGMFEVGSGAPRATGRVKAASIDTNEPVPDLRERKVLTAGQEVPVQAYSLMVLRRVG